MIPVDHSGSSVSSGLPHLRLEVGVGGAALVVDVNLLPPQLKEIQLDLCNTHSVLVTL